MFKITGSTFDRKLVDIDGALRVNVSQERYGHVIRVTRTAKYHARRLELPIAKAAFAAMAHDLAREWPGRQLIAYVRVHDGFVSAEEREKPVLLHGRAGAILLRRQFGVLDQDILEAIEHHTLGKAGMGKLAKLIFAADYLEPGRRYTDIAFRRSVKILCLNCMVRVVVEHSVLRHKDLHPFTAELYREVCMECSCGNGPIDKERHFAEIVALATNRKAEARNTGN